MTSNNKLDTHIDGLVAAQGLQRAAGLFPATVAAAIERGSEPLIVKDGGFPPITAPATVFRPATKGEDHGA